MDKIEEKRSKEMHKNNKFKAIVTIAVALAFVMPVAAFANNEKDVNDGMNNIMDSENLDFTHTVLAEYGTASWCGPCAPVNGYMYSIYSSGDYDFYYVTLNTDHENLANGRYWELPAAKYLPTVWFDGGYSYLIGNQGSTMPYINKIITCGSGDVADIDLDVVVNWMGDAEMEVTVNITNNEASSYNGHLHAYITEITSRWYDASGKKYHFSMIGYAFNQNINVEAGDTWSDIATWDGDSHGYGDITEDNIMVIATVFDSRTDYVDETTAATPNGGNMPPNKPNMPSGQIRGGVGVEYVYTSNTTDPDEDDVYYLFDWGDGNDTGWLGPYNSGDDVEASHAWTEERSYDVKVKAKDVHGAESSWSDPLSVTMPKIQGLLTSFFDVIEHYFLRLFSIIDSMVNC